MKLWTIRNEQLDAIQAALERRFVRRAIAYVRRQHPATCGALDERAIRASVETALEKRAVHRFDSEETVFAYLDLMYLLGFEFDTDPRCEWVRATLNDFDLGARTRLLLLVEQARDRAGKLDDGART